MTVIPWAVTSHGDIMIRVKDFKCCDCQLEFEAFIKDGVIPECPKCKSQNVNPNLGPTSFKVTGMGAYTTKMKV